MKNLTVIGLFPSQDDAPQVSASLEQSGIKNENYIIYKNAKERSEKQGFWKKLLGVEAVKNETPQSLITSVSVQNEQELDNIKKSFAKNKVVKMYEFQDMTLEEAKNLDHVRKIVALRAKSQIYSLPKTSIARKDSNEGINSELIV